MVHDGDSCHAQKNIPIHFGHRSEFEAVENVEVYPLPALTLITLAPSVDEPLQQIPKPALADAHNPENAIKFLKVYSSMEMQGPKAAIKNPSPLVGAPAVEELSAIEEIVANATSTSTNYGGLLAYAEFYNNILSPLSTKLLTGQLTAEQFIDELDAQTQAYYK